MFHRLLEFWLNWPCSSEPYLSCLILLSLVFTAQYLIVL